VGKETLLAATSSGNITITINVTPGSCTNNMCGLRRQSGSCEQGRCICTPGARLTSTFARNPNATARALVPVVPACRYTKFTPVESFSLAGMTARPGDTLDVAFTLEALANATAQCAGPDASLLPMVSLFKLPSCGRRAAFGHEVAAQQVSQIAAACLGGVYRAAVEVPADAAGRCFRVVVALVDGSKKRATVQVV
jgi:hypothetical protein